MGLACHQWVWHVLCGCGMSSVGASVGVSVASVGVAWPQWMWHCLSMCDCVSGCVIASVDVAWPQ